MTLQPSNRDDIILPSWVGKICSLLLLTVALALIFYGLNDGIINQEIAFRTKSGNVAVGKGLVAIIIGATFAGIGIALVRGSVLIFKSSKNS
jgi:hypothetical protein